jgi:hypothetical protein
MAIQGVRNAVDSLSDSMQDFRRSVGPDVVHQAFDQVEGLEDVISSTVRQLHQLVLLSKKFRQKLLLDTFQLSFFQEKCVLFFGGWAFEVARRLPSLVSTATYVLASVKKTYLMAVSWMLATLDASAS